MPFVAIPGNHDRRALVRETFPDPACGAPDCALNTVRRIDELDIFLIDSPVAGARRTASSTHRRLGSLTKRSVRRPRDLRSSFCIILRSTREFAIHRRHAAPKLRRACRSSWSTSARPACRGRTCSSFGANGVCGHFGQYLSGGRAAVTLEFEPR